MGICASLHFVCDNNLTAQTPSVLSPGLLKWMFSLWRLHGFEGDTKCFLFSSPIQGPVTQQITTSSRLLRYTWQPPTLTACPLQKHSSILWNKGTQHFLKQSLITVPDTCLEQLRAVSRYDPMYRCCTSLLQSVFLASWIALGLSKVPSSVLHPPCVSAALLWICFRGRMGMAGVALWQLWVCRLSWALPVAFSHPVSALPILL